jgi:hypothetical protein
MIASMIRQKPVMGNKPPNMLRSNNGAGVGAATRMGAGGSATLVGAAFGPVNGKATVGVRVKKGGKVGVSLGVTKWYTR